MSVFRLAAWAQVARLPTTASEHHLGTRMEHLERELELKVKHVTFLRLRRAEEHGKLMI